MNSIGTARDPRNHCKRQRRPDGHTASALFEEISGHASLADARQRQRALAAWLQQTVPRADEAAELTALLGEYFSGRVRDGGVWLHAAADTVMVLTMVSTALLRLMPGIPRELVAERVGTAGGFFVRVRPCPGHRGQ